MRRSIPILAIAALLLWTELPSQAQAVSARRFTDVQELVLRSLGDYYESLRAQAAIPGLAASIIGTDDVIWERGFGRQDTDRSIATRTDTPFHLDGLTQLFTSTLVLRCVEERRLSLDDRLERFQADSAEPGATIRQVLTHTSLTPEGLVFAYRPERFEALAGAVRECTYDSFRDTLINLLDRLAMIDSVPGADIARAEVLTDGFLTSSAVERYQSVLDRLATPYTISGRGQASPSQYVTTGLTPAAGLISTVRDIAQFDLALKKGVLLRPETLADIRRVPMAANGARLPHGLGWFVQSYGGETIIWQFGVTPNVSSSLIVSVPARGVTLVLLANSDGLAKPFALANGNVTASPFVRLFLGLAAR